MSTVEIELDNQGHASLRSAGMKPGRYRVSKRGDSFLIEPLRSLRRTEMMALYDTEILVAHQKVLENPELFSEADDLP